MNIYKYLDKEVILVYFKNQLMRIMNNTRNNIELRAAAVKIVNGRRVVVSESVNFLPLDIILGITISIIIGILGLIIIR